MNCPPPRVYPIVRFVSGSEICVPQEAFHVVILDIPFAIPMLPAGIPLSGTPARRYYTDVFRSTTLATIEALGERLALWVDHHDHKEWKAFRDNPRFRLVSSSCAAACATLVTQDLFRDNRIECVDCIMCHGDLDGLICAARFILRGNLPYPEALEDAVAADTRKGKLSRVGLLIERAIKARPDDATRRSALRWLLERDGKSLRAIKDAEAQFPKQVLVSRRIQEVGGCRILDARNITSRFDMTTTLCDLQKDDRIGIVIHRQRQAERIWIAGCRKGMDLPRLLDLPGGTRSRVCLDADHLEEAVSRINVKIIKREAPLPLPREATIEITRRCNLRCKLCPIGNGRARHMPDMNFKTLVKFIDMFGANLKAVCLHNYGEPLLHPSLADFIRYVKSCGLPRVFLTTNGSHMPPSLAEELIASGLDCIRFSVDTTDPKAYAQYRIGGNLSQVLDNMGNLRRARERRGADLPVIEAQALLMRQNEAFVHEFERIMLESGADRVRYKTVNIFMSGEALKESGEGYLPDSHHYTRYSTSSPECAKQDGEMNACPWPWEQAVVLADGTIVPCCHDFNADYPLGKITINGDRGSVWDTPERRRFMLRRILHPASIEMCRRCSNAVPCMAVHKLVKPMPLGNGRH